MSAGGFFQESIRNFSLSIEELIFSDTFKKDYVVFLWGVWGRGYKVQKNFSLDGKKISTRDSFG